MLWSGREKDSKRGTNSSEKKRRAREKAYMLSVRRRSIKGEASA